MSSGTRSSKGFEISDVVDVIREKVIKSKIPCFSRTEVTESIKSSIGLSRSKAGEEFWAASRGSIIKPIIKKGRNYAEIPLGKRIGEMKIGRGEFFYPIEMVKNYILFNSLADYPGAIFYLMNNDPMADDDFHTYDLDKWEFTISDQGSNLKGELRGIKTKTEPIEEEFFPIKLAGDTLMPEGQPELRVTRFEINNKAIDDLPKAEIVAQTTHKKIYHIRLERPLKVGSTFAIDFQGDWRGHLVSPLSYLFMPCIHLLRGVENEVIVISSDKPLRDVAVQKFNLCSGVLTPLETKTAELQIQSEMKKVLHVENQKRNEVYIVSFERVTKK